MARKTKTIKITVGWETWQKIDALDFIGFDTPKSLLEDAVKVRESLFDEGSYPEDAKRYYKYLNHIKNNLKQINKNL